jgi:PKD repeat protein
MKVNLIAKITLTFSFLTTFFLHSQQLIQHDHVCGFDEIHRKKMLNDENYRTRTEQFNEFARTFQVVSRTGGAYKIPVVVHVMETGTSLTQITDEQIKASIKGMNEMLRKIPGTKGDGAGVDTDIEFVLAVRDPNGNCTNGITRYDMTNDATYMANGVFADVAGISDASLKAYRSWDQTRYYNIWLVSEIDNNEGGSGIQGYAFFASSHGAANDGSVILVSNFRNPENTTAVHEIGHALNLYHTFEGDNGGGSCPPVQNGCGTGQGDCCGDTPPHRRSPSDCNVVGTNNCTSPSSSNSLFARNYLDYSSSTCKNMLTNDQKTRMIAAITSERASFLPENGNMSLVPVTTPTVDFIASQTIVCGIGQSIRFTDLSSCIPNTLLTDSQFDDIEHEWTITNGVNEYKDFTQNPVITFSHTGLFNVTLAVKVNSIEYSLTKQGFILVSESPRISCTPTSVNGPDNYGLTVNNVKLNTINKSTSTGVNGVYQNFACTDNTILSSAGTHTISVTIRSASAVDSEFFEAYIDFNDDGFFSNPSELIGSGSVLNGTTTIHSNFTIPGSAVKNKLLRMRIYGDIQATNPNRRDCISLLTVGDVEDYGVYISENVASVTIAAAPSNSITYGDNVTFTATPTNGGAEPSYAWYINGLIVSGETASTFDSNDLLDGDEVYSVMTSNMAGVIHSPCTSNVVTMQVVGAPISNFSANLLNACQNSSIQFTDQSLLAPTSWSWSFPGGTPDVSTSQNPIISYDSPGTYSITLTASNVPFGSGSTITKTDYITIYPTPWNTCNVTRSNPPAAGIGITNVKLNTINHTTPYDGVVVNNYACSQITTLHPSTEYPISVTVGSPNNQWVRVFIDYNNNGIFEAGESVFSPANGTGLRSGTFTTAANPTMNRILKMRVISDFTNTAPGACTNLQYGQVEEYGVIFVPNCTVPTVSSTSPASLCTNGDLIISATPSAGATIKWYDALVGGNDILHDGENYSISGNQLTIHNFTSTTAFYAEAVNGSCVSFPRTEVVALKSCPIQLIEEDCGKSLTFIDEVLTFEDIPNVNYYQIKVQGTNGNTLDEVIERTHSTLRTFRLHVVPGIEFGKTYNISVRGFVNGTWDVYGDVCQVSTPSSTGLIYDECGKIVLERDELVNFRAVPGANTYRIRIQGPNGYDVVRTRKDKRFRMNLFPNIINGVTYTVTIGWSSTLNADPTNNELWSSYGEACELTTLFPIKLNNSSCGATYYSRNDVMRFDLINGVSNYKVFITADGGYYRQLNVTAPSNGVRFSNVNGMLLGETYNIQIQSELNGVSSNLGEVCQVVLQSQQNLLPDISSSLSNEFLSIYPNPNSGSFKIQTSADCLITITNSLGQTIDFIECTSGENNYNFDLPIGVYFVSSIINGEYLVNRVVVQ